VYFQVDDGVAKVARTAVGRDLARSRSEEEELETSTSAALTANGYAIDPLSLQLKAAPFTRGSQQQPVLRISGLPAGSQLSDGVNRFLSGSPAATVDLAGWNLAAVRFETSQKTTATVQLALHTNTMLSPKSAKQSATSPGNSTGKVSAMLNPYVRLADGMRKLFERDEGRLIYRPGQLSSTPPMLDHAGLKLNVSPSTKSELVDATPSARLSDDWLEQMELSAKAGWGVMNRKTKLN